MSSNQLTECKCSSRSKQQAGFINFLLVGLFIAGIIIMLYGFISTIKGGGLNDFRNFGSFINKLAGITSLLATLYTAYCLKWKKGIQGVFKAILYLGLFGSVIIISWVELFPSHFKESFKLIKDEIFTSAHIFGGITIIGLVATLYRFDIKIIQK